MFTLLTANKSLDSTGFCAWVLPFGFSVLTVSPPVSQLRWALEFDGDHVHLGCKPGITGAGGRMGKLAR